MDKSDDNSSSAEKSQNALNRRNFLAGVGGLGLAAGTLGQLSKDQVQIGDITYNPNEEVAYIAGWSNEIRDGEVTRDPFYDTVSIEKGQRLDATRDAVREVGDFLQANFVSPDEHFSIRQSVDENSPTGRRLDVTVEEESPYSLAEIEDLLPYQIDGDAPTAEETFAVPLGAKQVSLEPQSHSCYAEPYPLYDDVPAAAPMATLENGENGNTAGPFWHGDYGSGWVTAFHVIDDGDPIGDDVYLLDEGHSFSNDKIGEVSDGYYEDGGRVDIAHVDLTVSGKNPHEWVPRIDYSDNEEHAIVGVISDQKLESEIGTGWNLVSQGQSTCRGVGEVGDVEYNPSNELVGVQMDAVYTENGDSGGILYHYDGSDAHMCGVIAGVLDNKTYGTTAETTEDRFNGGWLTQ